MITDKAAYIKRRIYHYLGKSARRDNYLAAEYAEKDWQWLVEMGFAKEPIKEGWYKTQWAAYPAWKLAYYNQLGWWRPSSTDHLVPYSLVRVNNEPSALGEWICE